MTRRDFTRATALLAAGLAQLRAEGGKGGGAGHAHEMPPHWIGSEQITMVAYPGMTALDLVGPQYAFAGLIGATVQVVSKNGDPVLSDTGLRLLPDASFGDSPQAPDLLFVGGGSTDLLEAMRDEEVLAFLADRGGKAGLLTSVCTGSLLLAAAGLLDGYRATSHWAVRDELAGFGARPVDERLVVDRNRITAAGVSAGLDLGLVVAERQRDALYAQCLQLGMEYAPQPPFDAGTPATAPAEACEIMGGMYGDFRAELSKLARARRGGA